MYFDTKGLVVIGAIAVGLFNTAKAQQSIYAVEMIAQPNKCVALTQGRQCYAQISVTWSSPDLQNLCLVDSETKKSLYCWEKQREGQFLYDLQASKNVTLSLVKADENDELPLASAAIQVTWLYEGNNRKRRWRLF